MQLTYPGTRISTLQEVFDFVECADPAHQILWNIESKINPQYPNRTLGVQDFVQKQHAIFSASPYTSSITVSLGDSSQTGNPSHLMNLVSKFRLEDTGRHEGKRLSALDGPESMNICVSQAVNPLMVTSALVDE